MQLITAGYTRLALIECSCCREDHTLEIIEDDGELYFEFKETQSKKCISDRIKRKLDFLINWKEYISVNKITYNGILLKYGQIKTLYELLLQKFPNITVNKNLEKVKLLPIKYKNQKDQNEYKKILFDNGEIILSEDIQMVDPDKYTLTADWFTLGYHLPENTKFSDIFNHVKYRHFYNGDYYGYIQKEQVPDFTGALSAAMEEFDKYGQ